MRNSDLRNINPKCTISANPRTTVNYTPYTEKMMSNYVLHLPEHTWNDLALTERELPSRKSYSTNVPPAKRKLMRTTKSSKPTKAAKS